MEIDKLVWDYSYLGTVIIRHKQTQDIDLKVDFVNDCLIVPENCIPTQLSIDLLRQFLDNYETAKVDYLKEDEPPF